jgi:hypothetical protein
MQILSEFCGGRIISRNLWLPRSPDLSPPDFYLWNFWRTCAKSTHTHERNWIKYYATHFKRHCRNSSTDYIKHEEKSECRHLWTRCTLPTHSVTCFLLLFQCNLFYDKHNMYQEWAAWLFEHSVYVHPTSTTNKSSFCIYGSCTNLTANDYFLTHEEADLRNGEVLCFLCGKDWIIKYYLDELRLQS